GGRGIPALRHAPIPDSRQNRYSRHFPTSITRRRNGVHRRVGTHPRTRNLKGGVSNVYRSILTRRALSPWLGIALLLPVAAKTVSAQPPPSPETFAPSATGNPGVPSAPV